jgi:ketosteroid isomerase-like protein
MKIIATTARSTRRLSGFGKSVFVVFVSSWLVAAVVTVSAQNTADKSDPQSLIRLEASWNEAFYNKDVSFLERVLAAEFIATYEDGSQGDRAKEISLTKDFNQQVESAKQDDFVVKIYGDAAVVWFTLHMTGPKQGQRIQVDLRYVDVFVWRDGRWQCVSSHSTKITGL